MKALTRLTKQQPALVRFATASRQVLRRALVGETYRELRQKFGGESRRALRAMARDSAKRQFRERTREALT